MPKRPPARRARVETVRDPSKHTLLTREQEHALGSRIQTAIAQGSMDDEAVEILCRHNLDFVKKIAKDYTWALDFEDMVSAGNFGLVTAARKFDPSHGVKFVSYAVWWIEQAMWAEAAKMSRGRRIPLGSFGHLMKFTRVRDELGVSTSAVYDRARRHGIPYGSRWRAQ